MMMMTVVVWKNITYCTRCPISLQKELGKSNVKIVTNMFAIQVGRNAKRFHFASSKNCIIDYGTISFHVLTHGAKLMGHPLLNGDEDNNNNNNNKNDN
jgi:hypothetical protein